MKGSCEHHGESKQFSERHEMVAEGIWNLMSNEITPKRTQKKFL
jgi:hypothetical protein